MDTTAKAQVTRTANLTIAEYDATRNKVEKINARAARRGWTGRFEVTGEQVTRTGVNDFGFEVTSTWIKTTITGHAPSYKGWTFLAELDFDPEAGLITRPAPGTGLIDRDGIREGECDHCGITRNRRKVYLVRNDETGEQKQVGSTCIKDFLGWDGRFVFIPDNHAMFDDGFGCGGEGFGGAGEPLYTTDSVLAAAWGVIQACGYRKADGLDGTPTKTLVAIALNPGKRYKDQQFAAGVRPYADRSKAQAAIIKAYLLSDAWPADGEYAVNLKAILAAEHVDPRNFGLLVSAPQAWARAVEREARRQALANEIVNDWFGTPKQRLVLTVRVRSIREIVGDWGVTTLYTLITRDGHMVKYFASRRQLGETADAEFTVKATIKGFDEWDGVKSTVITRAVIQEEAKAAA